jgi:hypothetical protein
MKFFQVWKNDYVSVAFITVLVCNGYWYQIPRTSDSTFRKLPSAMLLAVATNDATLVANEFYIIEGSFILMRYSFSLK